MLKFFCKISPRLWANVLIIIAFLIWLVIIGFNVMISFESLGRVALLLFAIGGLCTVGNIAVHWSNDIYISSANFKKDKIVMYVLFSASCLLVSYNRLESACWFILAGLIFGFLSWLAIINRERAVFFHE